MHELRSAPTPLCARFARAAPQPRSTLLPLREAPSRLSRETRQGVEELGKTHTSTRRDHPDIEGKGLQLRGTTLEPLVPLALLLTEQTNASRRTPGRLGAIEFRRYRSVQRTLREGGRGGVRLRLGVVDLRPSGASFVDHEYG